MWCVIPVAGRATRLAAQAAGRPKALIEIGGRSIIEHLLDRIGPPVTDVCLVTGATGSERFARLDAVAAGPRIHLVSQPEPAGVADAVGRAAPLVRGPFVVIMGDCWYERPLADFPERWAASGADGAVLVEPPTEANGQPVGLVRVVDRRVTRIFKAPWADEAEWRVAGAYLFGDSFFEALTATTPAAASGEVELEDVVTRLIEAGETFQAIPYAGWRRNINTPADLQAVRERIAVAG